MSNLLHANCLLASLVMVLVLHAPPVGAETFVVDTTADAVDTSPGDGSCATADGECTLRAAIEESKTLPGDDVIELPPGVYAPDLGPLSFAECSACDALLITGSGAQATVLDGGAAMPLFDHSHVGGPVRLEDLSIRSATVRAASASEALQLNRTELSDVVFDAPASPGAGRLVIEDSSSDTPLVIRSSVTRLARVALRDLAFSGPLDAEMIDSTVSGDVIWLDSAFTLTLDRVQVLGGVRAPGGFAPKTLNILNSTIHGSAASGVIMGGELGATFNLVNSTVSGATDCGVRLNGRTNIATIRDSDLTNNHCGLRMAFAPQAARIKIERCRITDNADVGLFSAGSMTGAEFDIVDSVIGRNGGVGLDIESWNEVTLRKSAVHDNGAGGINVVNTWPTPISQAFPELTAINSTVSGNRSEGSGAGVHTQGGIVVLRNVTVTQNTADTDGDGLGDGGGIAVMPTQFSPGSMTLQNTIVAGNVDPGMEAPDCAGTLDSEGFNLVESSAGCTLVGATVGNLLGQSAQLEPLGDHGGPTPTHALMMSSPALEAGDPSGCKEPSGDILPVDQRGVERPQCAVCDIGAYELVGAVCDRPPVFSVARDQFFPGVGTMREQVVYSVGESIVETANSFLPGRVGLNALDALPNGDVIFSVAVRGGVHHSGGYIQLRPSRLYRWSDDTSAIEPFADWSAHGIDVGGVDALDITPDGRILFSTETTRFVAHGSGFEVLRPQSVYAFDPLTAGMTRLLDGLAIGLADVDAVQLMATGDIAISMKTNRFVAGAFRRQENVYVVAPDGTLSVLLDGVGMGLQSLDAFSGTRP